MEQPAIGLFAELGWQTVVTMEEVFGIGGTLGRVTIGEVGLVSRLRVALMRLNPALPPWTNRRATGPARAVNNPLGEPGSGF